MPPVSQQYKKEAPKDSYTLNREATEKSVRRSSVINKSIDLAIAMKGAKEYTEDEMIVKIKFWMREVDKYYDEPFH